MVCACCVRDDAMCACTCTFVTNPAPSPQPKCNRSDAVIDHPVGDDEPEHVGGTTPLSGIKIVQKTTAHTGIILKKVKMERDEAK